MKQLSIRENDAALVPIIERLIAQGERDQAWVKTTYLKSAVKRKFFYQRIKEMATNGN